LAIGLPISLYGISVIQYRKTNIKNGGEKMHHGEQDICCCTSHTRQFLTKKEKIKKLTEYKEWLDDESKGVEEAIEKLKSN
jgi:ribosome recycling factor